MPRSAGSKWWRSEHPRLTFGRGAPEVIRLVIANSREEALVAVAFQDVAQSKQRVDRAVKNAQKKFNVVRISAPNIRLADLRDHAWAASLGHRKLGRSASALRPAKAKDVSPPEGWRVVAATVDADAVGAIVRDPSRRPDGVGEELVISVPAFDNVVRAGLVHLEWDEVDDDFSVDPKIGPGGKRQTRIGRSLAKVVDEIGWAEPDMDLRERKRRLSIETGLGVAKMAAIGASPWAAAIGAIKIL